MGEREQGVERRDAGIRSMRPDPPRVHGPCSGGDGPGEGLVWSGVGLGVLWGWVVVWMSGGSVALRRKIEGMGL